MSVSSSRRRIQRKQSPVAVRSANSHLPSKWRVISITLTLFILLLLAWKYTPANTAPSLPILTSSAALMPNPAKDHLPASVPASLSEPGAKMRRVVDKKIANGMVTLTLQDEETGQLSIMTQPLDTSVDTVESGGKEQTLASAAVPAKQPDAVKDELATIGIETVKAGMTVPTRNPITGKTEFKKVARTFKHTAYEIVKLKLADGKTGKVVDTLQGTPLHPFFTPSGMVAMGDLKSEMKVITRRGPPLVVKSVIREPHPEGIAVYNFEVEGDHTYFVGKAEGGTWVHNDCSEIARAITGKFENLQCEACKNALVKAFRKNGISGEVVEIADKQGYKFILSKTYGSTPISELGWHVGVKVGDTVFDNIHKGGISYGEWLADFEARGGITVKSRKPF